MQWINRLLKSAREYTVWDFAFFKIALVSFGILAGAYFSRFFLDNIALIWVVFILAYIWVMYRTFVQHWH